MSSVLDSVSPILRAGRFKEAKEILLPTANSVSRLSHESKVVAAELLLHLGDTERAQNLALRECSNTLSPLLRSRCEVVIGLAKRNQAEHEQAESHFRTAFKLARESGLHEQAAWAHLHMFRTLAEAQPQDAVAAMLLDVRLSVARAGDRHASAYMHDAIALTEASAGRLDEARRHLRLNRLLLEEEPNAYLTQLRLISEFFVDFHESRFTEALISIRAARRLLAIVGEHQRAVIDCNEAHALLMTGQFGEAAGYLRSVVSTASPSFALGALDGLARLHLAVGELHECDRALESFDALSAKYPSAATVFAGRWNPIVRIKLLFRRHEWQAGTAAARKHLETAKRLGDSLLTGALSLLLVEGLANLGADAAAARALLSSFPHSTSPDQLGALYRVESIALRTSGGGLAEQLLTRAKSVWTEQDNQCALQESMALGESDPGAAPALTSEIAIDSLASVFHLSHNVRLAAQSISKTTAALGLRTEVRMDENPEARSGKGDSTVLHLGTHKDQPVTLVCRTPDEPLKAIQLSNVFSIARAALELERYRQDERKRSALWPASPAEEQAGALYVAEEMQEILTTARRVAATTVPLLITGESGTGKEVLARLVHAYSARAKTVFIPFNCASTPREMLDSQLFGHRRGAFTGAIDNFQGVIRAASGGTLLLDEIGDMPLDVQPKLLRFLESGEVHPIGEAHPVRTDVRVIAATNSDLDSLVSQGRFREDLLYRLNIVQLRLPPLRERRVEIPVLAGHYLRKFAAEYRKGDLRLAEETMDYLLLYRWPGNIRQLANEMRRLAALAEPGAVLMPEHLHHDIAAARRTIPPSERMLDPTELVVRLDQPMPAAVQHLEQTMVKYALRACDGRVEDAAARLGISRKGLYLKRRRFGIELADDEENEAKYA